MTIAISVGAHNLSAFPVILAVIIIIGAVLYFTMWSRRKPPGDRDR